MDLSFEQAMKDITWEEVVATIQSMAADLLEDTHNNPPPASPPSSTAINIAEQEVSEHPLQSVAAPALNVGQSGPIVHLGPMQAGFTPADSSAPSGASNDHSEQTMNDMEEVEDTFLMYIDEDTQDYCTPAYPPSSPPEPGAHQRPCNVLESSSTSAESAPPSRASTAVPQHTGRENGGEKVTAAPQMTENISGGSPEYPPPTSLPSSAQQQPMKVQSSDCWLQSEAFLGVNTGQCAHPSAVVSTAVPERPVKDVGSENGTATPEYHPPESSASSAPLTVAGPSVNTRSGFTPSDSGAPSVVSKKRKRKSMNLDESGSYMKKPRNTSVTFQEERPRVAAAPDSNVEPNAALNVPQRAKQRHVTPLQMAEMVPSTAQFVLAHPYAAIPVTTCCIFHQPYVQYYGQYYSQWHCQCYSPVQIHPDNACLYCYPAPPR